MLTPNCSAARPLESFPSRRPARTRSKRSSWSPRSRARRSASERSDLNSLERTSISARAFLSRRTETVSVIVYDMGNRVHISSWAARLCRCTIGRTVCRSAGTRRRRPRRGRERGASLLETAAAGFTAVLGIIAEIAADNLPDADFTANVEYSSHNASDTTSPTWTDSVHAGGTVIFEEDNTGYTTRHLYAAGLRVARIDCTPHPD